jgi:hypothetical protein
MSDANDSSTSDMDQFDEYEKKLEELNEGLLRAYAAGFSLAVESLDVDPDFSTDVDSLMNNHAVIERHYYFWDGKVKPLELWLQEQFDILPDEDERNARSVDTGTEHNRGAE